MGMTLWIHTLEEREYSKDSDDHSLMHRYSDVLDTICEVAGVRKLSDFFDFTDIECGFADEADESDDEPEIDPETGYAYGIDDMQWFPANDGLITLRKLREEVERGSVEDIAEDDKEALLEELDDCIAILVDTATRTGKFHLSVVE